MHFKTIQAHSDTILVLIMTYSESSSNLTNHTTAIACEFSNHKLISNLVQIANMSHPSVEIDLTLAPFLLHLFSYKSLSLSP